MHPVDVNADRAGKYAEHMGKYDFYSLRFPVPLSSVGSLALANNMFINVYGVDDEKEVIYPLRVSSTPVPDRHADLLLFECGGVQHYTSIRNFSRLVRTQLSMLACLLNSGDVGLSRYRLLPRAKNKNFPRTRHPKTTVSTVCSIR